MTHPTGISMRPPDAGSPATGSSLCAPRPDPDRTGRGVGGPGSDGFRPDLEGLRGIAVALVVLYHAAPALVPGGFIGVDAFFVLSGFLITGLLVREHERSGRIDLWCFYARRARRILPAAAVAIVVTLAVALVVLPPLDASRTAGDAAASAFSLANVRFAVADGDYFAPGTPSPFRQFWSLAVEEQFYLLWPAVILLLVGAGSLRRRGGIGIAAILAGSLVLSLWLTDVNAPAAFYGLPTRAWQLAAGGLLAVAWPLVARIPRPAAVLAGWAGIVLLAGAALAIGPTTAFPGIAALLPVTATLAVIAAAGHRPGAALLLETPPVRFAGRISYSLYLWHWPILVLPVAAGLVLDPALTVILVAVSVAVATVSWAAVETPFRSGRIAAVRPARAVAAGLSAILAIGAVSVGLAAGTSEVGVAAASAGTSDASGVGAVPSEDDPPAADDPDLAVTLPAAPAASGAPALAPSREDGAGPRVSPAAPPASVPPVPAPTAPASPSPAPSPTPAPTRRPLLPLVAVSGPVPADLAPSIGKAEKDGDGLLERGCGMELSGTRPPECVLGDPQGSITVVLIGDSHASQWAPAVERLAVANHWRFIPFTKYSCVFVDMRIASDTLRREYTECETWRELVVARVAELRPDLVLISSHRWFRTIVGGDADPVRQGAALARLIERMGAPTGIIADTPLRPIDVPACLSAHRGAVEMCDTRASVAFGPTPAAREREAARRSGARLIDLSGVICPKGVCPAVLGGYLTMRDDHHLTRTFARALAPYLGRAIVASGLLERLRQAPPPAPASDPGRAGSAAGILGRR